MRELGCRINEGGAMDRKELIDLYRAGSRDFSGAHLAGANLRGVDLSRADLSQANLRRADLREAKLYQVDLYEADLSEANLCGAAVTVEQLPGLAVENVQRSA